LNEQVRCSDQVWSARLTGALLQIGPIMLRKLFSGGGDGPVHRPYRSKAANEMYNLLFCDDPALFAPKGDRPRGVLDAVLADPPDRVTLESIGNDKDAESRVRVLAFNRLRAMSVPVEPKKLLGVIIEAPQSSGLDTLAIFADGRMRYINQSERIAIFEDAPPPIAKKANEVLKAALAVVDRIGPANEPRRPPPVGGNGRVTFLVSDGLYFGEAPIDDLYADKLGGPVIGNAAELLNMLIEFALKRENERPSQSN
jgi:hypothetical protein